MLFAVLIVACRNNASVQAGALVWCLLQVLLAQPLNTLAAQHWRLFASANYFGPSGLFAALVWGLPLLTLAVLCTALLLLNTARLAVTTKRMQLREEAAAKKKRQ